jgi:imidazolonepropionase-like amidohydrolase
MTKFEMINNNYYLYQSNIILMKKLFLFVSFFITSLLLAQETYIHCGKLIDTKNGKVMANKTIVVLGKTIKSIEDGFVNPTNNNTKVVDLKTKTVMPGWIDMHVHLEGESSPTAYLEEFTRNAINSGKIIGPRMFTAEKAIGSTGGHADPTSGYRKDLMGNPGPKEGVVNSIDDAKQAVRQRYKNGADWIKITATGGVLSMAKSGSNPQFTEEEIAAIVSTAKDYGMKVAAHAHGDEGMQRAVKAGVKTIEHGTEMSEATMDLMIKNNAYLVPTITAGKEVEINAKKENYYPAIIVPKALAIGPRIQATFGKAYKRGVPIAFGTDAGVFAHGQNAKEFIYMTEAGMPIMKAIQSATVTNAMLLDMDKQIGVLEPGYLADIIATEFDPIQDVNAVLKVVFVMKEGIIYKSN